MVSRRSRCWCHISWALEFGAQLKGVHRVGFPCPERFVCSMLINFRMFPVWEGRKAGFWRVNQISEFENDPSWCRLMNPCKWEKVRLEMRQEREWSNVPGTCAGAGGPGWGGWWGTWWLYRWWGMIVQLNFRLDKKKANWVWPNEKSNHVTIADQTWKCDVCLPCWVVEGHNQAEKDEGNW